MAISKEDIHFFFVNILAFEQYFPINTRTMDRIVHAVQTAQERGFSAA